MPSPSTSSPPPRVRQGSANTSAAAWCAASSSGGTPPVITTCSATPCRCASRSQAVAVGTAADEQQPRAGDPFPEPGEHRDQRVLPLARHQPGHAADDRRVAEAVALADLLARVRVRGEPGRVHAGRQVLQRGGGAERGREPGAGVAGDDGQRRRRRRRCGAAPCAPRAASTSRPRARACWRRPARSRRGAAAPVRAAPAAPPRRTRPPTTPCSRAIATARRATSGTGSISDVGCRTTG